MKMIRVIKANNNSKAYEWLIQHIGETPQKYLEKLNYDENIKLMDIYFKKFQKLTPELNNKLFQFFQKDYKYDLDISKFKYIPNEYLLEMQNLILKNKLYDSDEVFGSSLVTSVLEKIKKKTITV